MQSVTVWPEIASESQLAIYHDVIREAARRGLRFALGGSLAMALYAGRCRASKDLDLYVTPGEKDAIIDMLADLGLRDYFEQAPYDRAWIYRATNGEAIIDVIWSMANRRAEVDEEWMTRGPEVMCAGERLRLIPIEEMIWSKMYVLQRDRCDWPDILNLLDAASDKLDWFRLRDRVGADGPLLDGLLDVFGWLRPGGGGPSRERADLLDSRPWLMSLNEGGCGNHDKEGRDG